MQQAHHRHHQAQVLQAHLQVLLMTAHHQAQLKNLLQLKVQMNNLLDLKLKIQYNEKD